MTLAISGRRRCSAGMPAWASCFRRRQHRVRSLCNLEQSAMCGLQIDDGQVTIESLRNVFDLAAELAEQGGTPIGMRKQLIFVGCDQARLDQLLDRLSCFILAGHHVATDLPMCDLVAGQWRHLGEHKSSPRWKREPCSLEMPLQNCSHRALCRADGLREGRGIHGEHSLSETLALDAQRPMSPAARPGRRAERQLVGAGREDVGAVTRVSARRKEGRASRRRCGCLGLEPLAPEHETRLRTGPLAESRHGELMNDRLVDLLGRYRRVSFGNRGLDGAAPTSASTRLRRAANRGFGDGRYRDAGRTDRRSWQDPILPGNGSGQSTLEHQPQNRRIG